ncbi:hypothetical protein O0L34_g6142 [Tuta absoluta]|nr:hypothetical protein O0L34_g6142 [Tuta absoluta]
MTSVEEFNCLFCQESFDSKEELQIHFRKHGDPKFNQSLKNKPPAEMAGNGDKAEDGEVVNCDVCDEVFPTISKAITHKHKMHPDHDAKYFCPWCGKLFTMKHLYNKHIQSTHDSKEQSEEMGFHCDYCDVDFFVPSAVMYHNKFFHRQDTELAAIGHSKKLKMFNQEPLQIYYCPFCGEEYCNKVNLHKHMGDDHIDENQSPEDVLRCPLCEAVFYHLDAYELHLTFHSPDDQYSEENELIKEITEFSLETVPPMMEKVENESQEDEPGTSMGIEELLQQGMNDSNDGEPRKKKKHKKHKKSKKTITLDEFLNMHSDVLGEGLDVQGIVEVPSQVVTKQLRKPQQPRLKPGPKPLPTELAKLKKAGLIIKKKPSSFQGVKIANKNPIVNKTIIGNKILPSIQSKPETKTSSNAILSKLLNQTNSQIKIVKKSAEIISSTELSTTEKELCENKVEKNLNEDDHELSNNENGDLIGTSGDTNAKNIQDDKNNTTQDSESHTISSQESDNQCSTTDNVSNDQVKKGDSIIPLKAIEDAEDSFSPDHELKQCVQPPSNNIGKPIGNSINTVNALRNISQHITIKSVLSPNSSQKSSTKIENDETVNKKDPDNSELKEKQTENTKSNPLSAIQHLSHLTVKSNKPPEPKIIATPRIAMSGNVQQKNKEEKTATCEFEEDEHEENDTDIPKSITSSVGNAQDHINTPTKYDPLKNLSKHITVKSMSPSPNNTNKVIEKPDPGDNGDDLSLSEFNKTKIEKKLVESTPKKESAIESGTSLKSPGAKLCSPNHSPKVPKNEVQNNELVVYNPKTANENILKQLPNITAKQMNVAKNLTQKVTVQSATQSLNIQKGNLIQNSFKKIETQKKEDIEIFNIDDSDEEESDPQEQLSSPFHRKPVISSYKNIITNCAQGKSIAALKNLSKHITIKPKNISKPNIDERFEDQNEMEEGKPCFNNSDHETDEIPQSLDNEINSLLQTKLKSLGNLTMKPKISSPKNIASSHSSPKVKINTHMEDYDSEPDKPSNVKITELPDDYPSDEDIPIDKNKNEHESDENMTSDHEVHIEDEDDIEAQIKPTTLTKPIQQLNKPPPAFLNKLKHLTVKSLRENKDKPEDEEFPEDIDEDQKLIANKNIQLRQLKQDAQDANQETSNMPVKQIVRRATNQNTATSSNQVNTINKEVKVQTFQSQTVIEEITTTVTKTIRTVNQSTNQEFQSIGRKVPMHVRPQKIQGIRPNQQIKNFQGVSVRTGTPIRPRMRNPVMSPRPPAPSNVRPSGQLVPVRPGVNVARLSKPRMPAVHKNPTPSTSNTNKPVIGRPLKISPNAMMPFNKRPAPDEPIGPFSCFKKSKESLIPAHGSSDFYDNGGTSAVQYASSSQMSKSNFTSMTKTVKGNSVVTSTQIKSEVSTSSEQLNRLNSMSGLKVVKTSQTKQASKLEERVEVNPAKQNTLSAIEKLQRQGLLVKKPRIEEPEDSDHDDDYPNPDDMEDDYYDT